MTEMTFRLLRPNLIHTRFSRTLATRTQVMVTRVLEQSHSTLPQQPADSMPDLPDIAPVLDRFRSVLAQLPAQETSPGALAELDAEIVQFSELRARANRELLD